MNISEFVLCTGLVILVSILFIRDIIANGIKDCIMPDGVIWLIVTSAYVIALYVRGVDFL